MVSDRLIVLFCHSSFIYDKKYFYFINAIFKTNNHFPKTQHFLFLFFNQLVLFLFPSFSVDIDTREDSEIASSVDWEETWRVFSPIFESSPIRATEFDQKPS